MTGRGFAMEVRGAHPYPRTLTARPDGDAWTICVYEAGRLSETHHVADHAAASRFADAWWRALREPRDADADSDAGQHRMPPPVHIRAYARWAAAQAATEAEPGPSAPDDGPPPHPDRSAQAE